MKKTVFVWMMLMMCTAISFSSVPERCIVQVDEGQFKTASKSMSDAEHEALDIIGRNRESETVDLLLDANGMNIIEKHKLMWTLVKSAEQMRDDRVIDPQFLDYTEVTNTLAGYESSYPTRMKRYDLGTTAEGRHIWAMKISDNVTSDEDEPEILVLGLHQAREIMSTEVAMDMINYLAVNYGSNLDVTRWVDTWEIWVVPMLNPDGSAYCWSTDQYWTKNRRDLGGGVYGVDLGHNYPFNFGACFGSSSDPNSNSYRGPGPQSESEISAITTLAASHNFVVVLSYHSFDEFVLEPYGCYGDYPPDKDIVSQFGSSFASLIQKESSSYGYSLGAWWELLYANDGNETDYFYAVHGAYAYAIEVNQSSYYPSYTVRNQTVQRNRPGWQKVLNLYSNCPVLYGHVTDACTSQPVEATYYFEEYPMTETESPRTSDPVTGRYTCIGRSGTYTLVMQADGYLDKYVPVSMMNSPVPLDIQMIPYGQPGLVVWGTEINDSSGDSDWQLDPGETAVLRVSLYAPEIPISGISAVLSTSDSYVSVTDNYSEWPDLSGGQISWSSGNSFSIHASPSAPEGHTAQLTLTFTADQTLCDTTDQLTVVVQTFVYLCPFWGENMDTDPGWIIDAYPTSGSPAGPYYNWEYGVPIVGPATAYTGTNLYGTGLDGNYDNSWTLTLTTPPIDCSDLTDATLHFARWLEIENTYDHARVRIRNVAGGSWTNVVDISTSSASWTTVEYDISSFADGEESVEIRFDLRADSSENGAGYYIDDVMICGNYFGPSPPQPTPTIRPTRTPTQIPSNTPIPSFTPTPPTNTPSPSATPTTAPSQPTNTPITPTNTPTQIPPSPTPTPPPPTPTSTTIPGSPTNTSIPTFTPAPTFTQEPTNTIKPTETSTPTTGATHTPTPTGQVPTRTVTPTLTPVPPTSTPTTPGDSFSMMLTLSDSYFSAGERFLLECEIKRHGPAVTVDEYILLGVYGSYFFWPTWSSTLNFETHTFTDGYNAKASILDFIWPTVGGHADNLMFYGGCLYAGSADLIGDVTYVSFGY